MISLCQLGAGMIAASVLVLLLSRPNKKKFVAALTPEQQRVFRDISRERLMIYVCSLAAGGLLGWVGLQVTKKDGWTSVCTSVGIAATVAYFSYSLWPKSKWMLQYINDPTQMQLWLEMYRDSIRKYHLGFLLGLVGYAVIVKGACLGKNCPDQ